MPIIKSAKKRVKVAHKAAVRNSKTRRSLRTALKNFEAKPSAKTMSEAQSAIDTATKKGIIHKNKAARKKAQLAATAKKSGAKVQGKAKKPATAKKTTTTKKPAAKKAPAKKQTAKKTAAKKTK